MYERALSIAAVAATAATIPALVLAQEQPRLVLQITVDQLRGDLINRYGSNLGEGGFRYLLNEGIHYNNAHHTHANTETIVGHTTLATGANPAAHGMSATFGSTGPLARPSIISKIRTILSLQVAQVLTQILKSTPHRKRPRAMVAHRGRS